MNLPRRNSITDSNYHWFVLATVFIGTFMAPLDSSIVNIAMPTLSKFFSVDITTIGWVATAYLLATSSLLLTAGRLGDMIGHKRIYIAGFVTFTTASALCGLAGDIQQLIAFRVIQALGATCLMSTAPAILTDAFPPKDRGKALGMIGVAVSIGLTVGPFLGGIILSNFGWRWIFYVNVPIGIVAVTVASLILRESKPSTSKRFDYMGAGTAFAALLSLLLALSMGDRWGWSSTTTIALYVTAILFSVLFIMVEKREEDPMLDLSLFKLRLFSAANVSAFINYAAMFVVTFLIPFYLIYVLKETPQKAGTIMTAIPLTIAIVAPISGALSDRIGSRLLSSLGLGVTMLALIGLSQTSVAMGVMPIAVLLGVLGFGSGLFQTPNSSAIMGSVPKNRLGIASGMQGTMRNVGMVLGIALAGAIVDTIAPNGPADIHLTSAIHTSFIVGAAIAGLGVVTSLVRGSQTNELHQYEQRAGAEID
ncbi:MAG TPA: MFS transporter [Candidatus Aquicultor sp.]|jgi:EmrB/QacA subfamily drug resistance transporter